MMTIEQVNCKNVFKNYSLLNFTPSANLNLAVTPILLLVQAKLLVIKKPGLQSNATVKGKSNAYSTPKFPAILTSKFELKMNSGPTPG